MSSDPGFPGPEDELIQLSVKGDTCPLPVVENLIFP